MILYWIFYIAYIAFAFKDIKKAIIAWVPIHLLFNPAVLLWSFHPLLALQEAVGLTLPLIFFLKGGFSGNLKGTNRENFLFKSAFFVYLLSYGISTLFSPYNSVSTLLFSFKFFVNMFLLVWMFQKCLTYKEDLDFFLKTSIVITFLIVGLAVSEMVLGKNIWTEYVWATSPISVDEMIGRTFCMPSFLTDVQRLRFGQIRCYSFFSLHIGFGSACVIILSIIGLLWRKGYKLTKKRNNAVFAIATIALIVGVFLSNSKGPLLCMLVLFLVIFTPKQIFSFKVLIALIIGIFILFTYFPGYIDNLISLTDKDMAEEGGGSSIQLRMKQLNVALRMFEESPLIGNGPQSLRVLNQTTAGEGILGAESIWLRTLPELGLMGVFAYLWWYITSFNKLKRVIPTKELIIIMGGLFLIETTNGMRDTLLYAPVFLALRKYYLLNPK